jgi:hypothetical protein
MTALQLAPWLFGLTAAGGAGLLLLRLKGGNPPIGLALVHGTAAAASLVTLIVAVLGGAGGRAVTALVLFVLAALGGFVLLSIHLQKRLIPIPLILGHGLVAAAGFVALLSAVL